MRALLLVCVFVCIASFAFGLNVTISNVNPRRDINGKIMDIHDGNTLHIDNLYYYYGASYGNCTEFPGPDGCAHTGIGDCGFNLNHNVSLFTSKDLTTWEPAPQPVFQFAKDWPIRGIMFCPKVIYNRKTQLYVLWINWLDANGGFSKAYYGVATSTTPFGPFTLTNLNVTTVAYLNTGDFAFFEEADGSAAYIIYTGNINNGHHMSIERLTDDYQNTLGVKYNSGTIGLNVEAPSMFRRNDIYYAVFGTCCCYCGQGSPVTVYTSTNPLGPYTTSIVLTSGIPAQQTNILEFTHSDGSAGFIWQGDRWQSAPDRIKGHDYQYWNEIKFNGNNTLPVNYDPMFSIDILVKQKQQSLSNNINIINNDDNVESE